MVPAAALWYPSPVACRGVFFALTPQQAQALPALDDDTQVRDFIHEIEEAWDEDNLTKCDMAVIFAADQ